MAENELDSFIADVRQLIDTELSAFKQLVGESVDLSVLGSGKMVRSQMVGYLLPGLGPDNDRDSLAKACAAIEMVHTASLCHDDVVDESPTRRHRPALWQVAGSSPAVLVGDLLLCRALEFIVDVDECRFIRSFLSKTREVCETEARQELLWRGKILEETDCLTIARGKTGPLFAFLGEVCGGSDELLSEALEEVGYCLGAVYQILDDLVDCQGNEETAGKTVGRDRSRGKFTLPQHRSDGICLATERVRGLFDRMFEKLGPWPRCSAGLEKYVTQVLQPVFGRQLDNIDLGVLIGADI